MAGSTHRSSKVTAAAAATALLLLLLPAATAVCDRGDKASLLELKNYLRNPAALSSWRIATDCCDDWAGTQCGSHGRVINVEISGANDAIGSLPPEIGNLSFLQALTLSKLPNLTGPIPAEICQLRQLAFLQLQTNGLTGAIPDCIGQLRNLYYLSLAQNKLTGGIPSSLGSALNIIELYLDSNQLTGPVPASLANLQLQKVNISRNNLSGDAPALFSAWKTAKVIDFSRNAFHCSLSVVSFPTTLEFCSISENDFYGSVAWCCDRVKGLKTFDVSKNGLTGDVSDFISSWTKAEYIDISDNLFYFNLTSVRFPTGLRAFNIRQNSIYGTIPPNADGMTGLRQIDVSYNLLCGSIPQGGVINRFPLSAFNSNPCLCGRPMESCITSPCECDGYSATATAAAAATTAASV